jgi:hypothetical protein
MSVRGRAVIYEAACKYKGVGGVIYEAACKREGVLREVIYAAACKREGVRRVIYVSKRKSSDIRGCMQA